MSEMECVSKTRVKLIKIGEKGRSAVFKNDSNDAHELVKVDGCLVLAGKRADWIVTKCGVGSVIVELKGSDVDYACQQLFETLRNGKCADILEPRVSFLVVCSRVPKYDTNVQKAKLKARKAGIPLAICCSTIVTPIESLL